MASSSAPVHFGRYLSMFLVLFIGVYLLAFLTGDKRVVPRLGIDLQGGTRVTLTARTPDGSRPSREALSQAQQIISSRVNGLGVSGSEVVVDGDNLVITVPGNDGNEARNLGQTARLYIRPVLNSLPVQRGQDPKPGSPAGTLPNFAPMPPDHPGAQPRPYLQDPTSSPSSDPMPSPVPTGAALPGEVPSVEQPAPPDPRKDLAERIAEEKKWRQSTKQSIQFLALQFESTHCDKDDILAGNDDPNLPLATCSTDHNMAYLLAPSIISGDQIQTPRPA